MEVSLIGAHLGLSVMLFLCMNWIGKHSLNAGYIQMSVFVKTDEAPAFNFLYRSFAPVVFITLVSALSYTFKQDWLVEKIYMVVVYHAIGRLVFNVLTGRGALLNWSMQVAYIVVSASVAYYIYSNLIIDKAFFFPEAKDIGNALWLGVLGFIYHTCNAVRFSDTKTKKRKDNYLKITYQKYKELYGSLIEDIAQNNNQERLIYAVLIYENFNRPKLYRLVENVLFLFGLARTLGVMQVTTDKFINDRESVKLGSIKIVNDYQLAVEKDKSYYSDWWSIRRFILKSYNPDDDYIYEVVRIDNELESLFYKDIKRLPNDYIDEQC